MEIVHRISFNAHDNQAETDLLRELKLKYTFIALPAPAYITNPVGLVVFEIAESDSRWAKIERVCKEWNVTGVARTKFTQRECAEARFLELSGCRPHGYPMPDDDAGYLSLTYDKHVGCQKCGVGRTQIAPFRMKGEPKWGSKQILQLNWIGDEYFVTPDAYISIFSPFAIPSREVLHHKSGHPLKSIVQLVVESISNSPLNISKPFDEICSLCGCGKFHPHTLGFFPRFLDDTNRQMLKSKEFFGSGGSAWHATFIAHELYQAMVSYRLKGVDFYPLQD